MIAVAFGIEDPFEGSPFTPSVAEGDALLTV